MAFKTRLKPQLRAWIRSVRTYEYFDLVLFDSFGAKMQFKSFCAPCYIKVIS